MAEADKLILIARAAGAHGVRGEVRLTAYGEDPMALVRYRDLRREDGSPALTVLSGRVAKGALVARTRELQDRDAAEAIKGLQLYIPRSRLPEPDEDEFYLADLVGLEVRTPAADVIGRVGAVHDFGAGDILEITPSEAGPTWLLPFTREAVPEVRLAEGWLLAVPPQDDEGPAG